MKEFVRKLNVLLHKDVGDESQSNTTTILVRLLAVTGILFYLIDLFVLIFMHSVSLCLITLLSLGLLLGTMICSYENQVTIACVLYCFVTIFLAALFTLVLGQKTYFTFMIPITVLIIFFSLKLSDRFKIRYSVIIGIFLAVLFLGYEKVPHLYEAPTVTRTIFLLCNIAHFSICLALIGFSFCQRFSQSEEKILQYNKKLQTMVSIDSLTSLWNRRAMNEHLARLQTDYTRHRKEFSVAIMDIDFFKNVNDTYGHVMGDAVLVHLSELLEESIDGHGHVARWGGEEFLLTFENMSFEKAVSLMEKIREKVEKEPFSLDDKTLNITITAGIEEYGFRSTLDTLLTKADEKLYKGKTSGRNQTVSSLY